MTTVSSVHSVHSPCCHHGDIHSIHLENPSKLDRIVSIVEKVSLVAIGIFSAMISIEWFVPSFVFGFAIGLWQGTESKKEGHSPGDPSLCAHGFMEHLTGVKLPRPLSLAANIAILAAHIEHHAPVFVPIVGATMGIWAGRVTCRISRG